MKKGLLFALWALPLWAGILVPPPGCDYDQECVIDIPGAVCADGTQSFITVVPRRDSTDLLLYLQSGGACWSASTCTNGFAQTLTRKLPNADWNNGTGIRNRQDSANPFSNFTAVTIAYCTGDMFAGDTTQTYRNEKREITIRHRGYLNASLSLEMAKHLFPDPERVVMLGQSAGGMGTYFQIPHLDAHYPYAEKFVIADAGTPFKPPYINAAKYEHLLQRWNVTTALPTKSDGTQPAHFGEIIEFNSDNYAHIKFGLIQSYSDYVMNFFAVSVGTNIPLKAVRQTMVDVADNHMEKYLGNNRVFFIDNWDHTHTNTDLNTIESMGVHMGDWISAMLTGQNWESVRPDKTSRTWEPANTGPDLWTIQKLLGLETETP